MDDERRYELEDIFARITPEVAANGAALHEAASVAATAVRAALPSLVARYGHLDRSSRKAIVADEAMKLGREARDEHLRATNHYISLSERYV